MINRIRPRAKGKKGQDNPSTTRTPLFEAAAAVVVDSGVACVLEMGIHIKKVDIFTCYMIYVISIDYHINFL